MCGAFLSVHLAGSGLHTRAELHARTAREAVGGVVDSLQFVVSHVTDVFLYEALYAAVELVSKWFHCLTGIPTNADIRLEMVTKPLYSQWNSEG